MFLDTAAALDPAANQRRKSSNIRPMIRPGELGAAWRAAGFNYVAETALYVRMDFASFEDYWIPYTGSDGTHAQYMDMAALDCCPMRR